MKPVSIEEACADRGYDLKQIEDAAAMMPASLQKYIRAAALRAVVVESINEGQVPDPNDGSWKHEVVFDLTKSGPSGLGLVFDDTFSWHAYTGVGARLQILDEDNAEYFGTHPAFQELHHDALTYKKEQ